MLVTGGTHAGEFLRLLGNGHEYGIERLSYALPGAAPAGSPRRSGSPSGSSAATASCVMLADNVFERSLAPAVENFEAQERGARIILLARSRSPEHLRHLGVPELDGDGVVARIVEKPEEPPSEYAVTGVYFYDATVFEVIPTLEPSGRGELEITDVNNHYVEQGDDGVRRARGVLGRRRRVDRRLLRGQRLRARARRQPRPDDRGDDPHSRCDRCADERGWFAEVRRESRLPKPTVQTNVSFSRRGRHPRAALPRARPGRPLRLL